ncbi:MAG: shikimate kinase [Clostridia bacterium]|nr:shikimate kinase [Clostridia bacterium]
MANLYLVGLPGAGKTTVGRIVARRLNLRFVDLDRLIMQREGATISELFHADETAFRDKEAEALRWVKENLDHSVVATGGGIVERQENIDLLRKEKVLYVVRHPRSILTTLNTDKRPVFHDDPNRIYPIARRRIPLYESIADAKVTNNRSLHSCIGHVLDQLKKDGFPDSE